MKEPVKYPAASNGASSWQHPGGGVFDPRGGLRSATVGAKRVPPAHSTAKWTRERVRLAHCPRE